MIDYFLQTNNSVAEIAKAIIAAVIFARESAFRKQMNGDDALMRAHRTQDDWIRLLLHKLMHGIRDAGDIMRNDVVFLTFNYDCSLERRLFEALRSFDIFTKTNQIDEFMEKRVFHIYGSVDYPGSDNVDFDKLAAYFFTPNMQAMRERLYSQTYMPDIIEKVEGFANFVELCLKQAQSIRTIAPYEKEYEVDIIDYARSAIANATTIYILGYGFDEENSNRIGLSAAPCQNRRVFFTNKGNLGIIDKASSELFGVRVPIGQDTAYVSGGGVSSIYHKSDGNVYQALSRDFGL